MTQEITITDEMRKNMDEEGKISYVIQWYTGAYDYDYEDYASGPSYEHHTDTVESYLDWQYNIEEGVVMLKTEYEKAEFDKEAVAVEGRMSNIMHKAGITNAFSGEFIKAVMKETQRVSDDWEDQLERMAEDGLCGGFGMTAQQYFDDREYMQGRMMSDLEEVDILDTMQKHFPMRMARAWDEYNALPKEEDEED
jgi:hypothetical protein